MPFPSRGLSARQPLTHTKLRACQLRHCRGLLSPVGALKIRSCSPDEARKALNCSIGAPRVTPSPNIYYFSCSVTYLSHTHTCLFFTLVSNRQKATQNIVKENILFSTFYRGAQIASTNLSVQIWQYKFGNLCQTGNFVLALYWQYKEVHCKKKVIAARKLKHIVPSLPLKNEKRKKKIEFFLDIPAPFIFFFHLLMFRGSCAGVITLVFSFDFIGSRMGPPPAPERGRVQVECFWPLSCFSFFLV